MHHRMEGLCIELAVVHGYVRIDGSRHLHADETSVAREVGQQILVVACGNERGISAHFQNARSISLADAGRGFLQQVLQERLLGHADLVELVKVHQEETTQISFGIALAAEIQAVRIAEAEFGRKQDAAEGRFAIPLRTDEHRSRSIAMLLVASHPVRYHAQEPTVEQVTPMRMTAHYSVGQLTDAVTTIPFAQVVQIFLHGVVSGHIVRMQESVDVPVPSLDTFLQCLDGDAVSGTFVQGHETETDAVAFAVFQVIGHRIVTDFVSAFQELFQSQGRILFAGHGRPCPESLHLGIDIVESGTEARLIFIIGEMAQGAIHRLFLGDARLEALFRQRSEQRNEVIASLPVLHRIEGAS